MVQAFPAESLWKTHSSQCHFTSFFSPQNNNYLTCQRQLVENKTLTEMTGRLGGSRDLGIDWFYWRRIWADDKANYFLSIGNISENKRLYDPSSLLFNQIMAAPAPQCNFSLASPIPFPLHFVQNPLLLWTLLLFLTFPHYWTTI